jgi:hypothetical protein
VENKVTDQAFSSVTARRFDLDGPRPTDKEAGLSHPFLADVEVGGRGCSFAEGALDAVNERVAPSKR